jgi:aromatic ring-cleaving dioxygenase
MDPAQYTYPWPLQGYQDQAPLPEVQLPDKSIENVQTGKLSSSYETFTKPLDNGIRGAFDVHVYYCQQDEQETAFARALWERTRREFPELRIYKFWDRPVGPHLIAMFEVNLFTPAQFGAFVPWLAINRGPLSVLIHPNTVDEDGKEAKDEEERNHTQRAIWMGERLPIRTQILRKQH